MVESIDLFYGVCLGRPQAHAPGVKTVIVLPTLTTSCPMSALRRGGELFCRALESRSLGEVVFSETSSSKSKVDYLGESTKGDLNIREEHLEAFGMNAEAALYGPIEEIAKIDAKEAEALLSDLGIVEPFSTRHSAHGIFCSRTLNLRSISAIGYDMDYTLIHYNVMDK